MWHLWRQPWRHRRHGKCRMTQTFTRRGYGTVFVFSLCYFHSVYVFEVGEFNSVTFSTLPPPVDLENPVWTGNTGTSRLPIFSTGGILWYYLHSCFRGRGIQWWHFRNSTTTRWPQKSSLNRKYWNFEVTHLFHWWNFMILPTFMFSRSRNSMVTLSKLYHHQMTSKNPVWTGNTGTSRLPIFSTGGILWYYLHSCFRGRGIQWWHFQNSTTTRSPRKSGFEPEILEFRGYPSFPLVEFYDITYIHVFEVEEFNGDTFETLPPPDDLKNPVWTGNTGTSRLPIVFHGGKLPVNQGFSA